MKKLKKYSLEGFAFDKKQAWRKLSSKIHAGSPGKAATELIQNAIDASDASVPFTDRTIRIETTPKSFSVIDYGMGFTEEKLRILLTMGATDKANDDDKLGNYGLGFYSLFNRALGTQKVELITKIQDTVIRLIFTVIDPDEMPLLKIEELSDKIDYGTRIFVTFSRKYSSVESCLYYAKKAANNFPANIIVNNKKYKTIWLDAQLRGWHMFENENCLGFLRPGSFNFNKIVAYCKFTRILSLPTGLMVHGYGKPEFNLNDYHEFPYFPGIDCIINCNNLNLTISRDGFYLDMAYFNMKDLIKKEIFKLMLSFDFEKNLQVTLANMFIFRKDLRTFLETGKLYCNSTAQGEVLEQLSKVKIFRLSGKREFFSLHDLKNMLSANTPLFYSPNKKNIDYLAGNYKHDYILLCERVTAEGGANEFWKKLLGDIFKDIVNLDTIQEDNALIKKLVDRGIIDKDVLSPLVSFIGEKKLRNTEFEFLSELGLLLNNKEVLKAIEKNLFIEVDSIRPVFFEVEKEGAYISSGFFNEDEQAISDEFISNFVRNKKDKTQILKSNELLLGLRKDHILIEQLIKSKDEQRAYYALTIVASEITASQKLIVPYSNFFHLKKEALAKEIRNALINTLIINAA